MSKSYELYVFNQFPQEKDDPDLNRVIFRFTTSVYTYVGIDFSSEEGPKITGMGWSRGGIDNKIKFKSQKEAWGIFKELFKIPVRLETKDL